MRLLGLAAILGILICSSALFAFDRPDDVPGSAAAPKRLTIQLCTPTAEGGAGCTAAGRVGKSTTFGMRHGVNASIATIRYGISELSEAPKMIREAIAQTGAQIRGAGSDSACATDSMLAVLYSLTTAILRTASSFISALASAIWPF
ncbi:hypothetical protein HUU59_12340 [bacterium]|nr:hypothetical protein [bacterium]